MMTLAAALSATALMAEVKSVNAVGYLNTVVTQGFNMVSVNFDNIADASAGINMSVAFPPNTAGLSGAQDPSLADNVLVFDNTTKGYSAYFLYYTTKTSSHSTRNYTWRLTYADPANVTLKSGDAVWFNKRGAGQVTFPVSGEVPNDASQNRTLKQGFNMIGNLYSADWTANDLGATWWDASAALGGQDATVGDNILLFDNKTKGYTAYFLYYTTKTTSHSTRNYTWRASYADLAPTNFLKMGNAAWYNRKGPEEIVMPTDRPYTL
jgi:hypothetical protein